MSSLTSGNMEACSGLAEGYIKSCYSLKLYSLKYSLKYGKLQFFKQMHSMFQKRNPILYPTAYALVYWAWYSIDTLFERYYSKQSNSDYMRHRLDEWPHAVSVLRCKAAVRNVADCNLAIEGRPI